MTASPLCLHSDPGVTVANAQFEVFVGLHGYLYYRLRGTDGAVLLKSESYASKPAVIHGIESLQNDAFNVYDVQQAVSGAHYFIVLNPDGQIIAHASSLYDTEAACEEAMLEVQKVVPNAALIDLT